MIRGKERSSGGEKRSDFQGWTTTKPQSSSFTGGLLFKEDCLDEPMDRLMDRFL